jgi:hypothetical protein
MIVEGHAKETGVAAAIDELLALTERTITATKLGQVVETDLLSMRIGIIAEALRHSDKTVARQWLGSLNILNDRLAELSIILDDQRSKMSAQIGERAKRAIEAYR